jgi:pimeloyl-ACP methyl ester carboxylesterase
MTAYLMALDDRIRCAAPSCYLTSLERLFATIGPQDAEQNIPGQVAFGMEHADYVTMRAPKPTLICIATRDFFDRQGALATFQEAKRLYGVMGKEEGVDLFEFNDTHGFSKPRREAAMRWMRRWLMGKDDAPAEPDFPVAKDVEIQCTETGQVLRDLKGKSVFDLNVERAKGLAAARSVKDLPGEVRGRIGYRAPAVGLKPETRGGIRRGDVALEKLVFKTEPGIAVPAVRLQGAAAAKPVVVYVSGAGKIGAARPEGPAEALARAGRVVVVPDLRGWGETAPEDKGGKQRLTGADWREAFLGFHINRPLLGQRVYDLLSIIGSLGEEVEVVGEGAAGPVVLHAAFLDPRIRKVTLEGSVLSWNAVVGSPIGYGHLANVVPGALESYDLPDLAAALAPRPLEIRSPVTPSGAPVTPESLEEAYAACRAAYERAGAKESLVLRGR